MLMHNFLEYSDNYSKTLETLWQYYTDEPALYNDSAIFGFPDADNNSTSFKSK